MRRLLFVDEGASILASIAAVVVPTTLTTIVVVTKDEGVASGGIALSILDVCDAVELFADGALHDHVLLILVVLGRGLEVQLIVICIGDDHFGLLHVHADRQNAL